MRTLLSLLSFLLIASLLTSCQVETDLNPTSAYLGTYSCTLSSKTNRLTERNQTTETKIYTGQVSQTAGRAVALSLVDAKGSQVLTVPMMLTAEALVVPQFETTSSTTSGSVTTYLSSYYVGNGKLQNQTLTLTLNAANYQIVGATGNQVQLSNSDLDCNCVKRQSVDY